MIDFLTSLIVKVIPDDWYSTKKTCDIITKICETIVVLDWWVWLSITIIAIAFFSVVAMFLYLKILKLKRRADV